MNSHASNRVAQPAAAASCPPNTIAWLIGSRAAANEACARLGIESVQVSPTDTEQMQLTMQQALRSETDAPAAILAVTEAAVPLAAELSIQFGLPSITPRTAELCSNKISMKAAAAAAGIPTARWIVASSETTVEEVIDTCGLPVVIKQPVSSGGRGVRTCRMPEEVQVVLARGALCESRLVGVEMSVESLLQHGRCVFRNQTRYLVPGWASIVPAGLTDDLAAQVDILVDRVHAAFGCTSGMTHIEVFLTPDGVVLGEIAARPPGGRLMELIANSYGFDPWEALLSIALDREVSVSSEPKRFSGAWFLHPGPGVVDRVSGLDLARSTPGVIRISMRARPGQVITTRIGTGQSLGTIYAQGSTMSECEQAMTSAHELVSIELQDSAAT